MDLREGARKVVGCVVWDATEEVPEVGGMGGSGRGGGWVVADFEVVGEMRAHNERDGAHRENVWEMSGGGRQGWGGR